MTQRPHSNRALAEWVHEHHGLVYRTAYRLLKNAADAEDATQATFSALASRPESLSTIESPRAYLARSALNQAKNLIRSEETRRVHEGRRGSAAPTSIDAREDARAMDDVEALSEALNELPDTLRLPVVLHYCEGLKYREVAVALECPEGTVAKRISDAKDRLEKRLTRSGAWGALAVFEGPGFEGPVAEALFAQLPAPSIPDGLVERLLSRLPELTGGAAGAGAATASVGTKSTLTTAMSWGVLATIGILLIAWATTRDGGAERDDPTRTTAAASESTSAQRRVEDHPESATPTGLATPAADEAPASGPKLVVTLKDGATLVGDADVRLHSIASPGISATAHSTGPGEYTVSLTPELLAVSSSSRALPLPGLPRGGSVEATVEAIFGESEPIEPGGLGLGNDASASDEAPETDATEETERQSQHLDWSVPGGTSQQWIQTEVESGWFVTAHAPGYLTARVKIHRSLARGHATTIDLDPIVRRSGFVSGPAGPIADARLRVVARIGESRHSTPWSRPSATGQFETTSDATGRFEFDQLPAGRFIVEATADDHLPARFPLNVDRAAAAEPVAIELAPSGILEAAVRDAETDLPVRGARVALFRHGKEIESTATDELGHARITGVGAGAYTLTIGRGGYSAPALQEEVHLVAGRPVEISHAITGARIVGRIVALGDLERAQLEAHLTALTPYPGSDVYPTAFAQYRDVVEDRFDFDRIVPGRYLLSIQSSRGKGTSRWLDAVRELEVTDGETLELEVRVDLPESGFVITLVDERGRPLAGHVSFRRQPTGGWAGSTRIDENESVELRLADGRYRCLASAKGYRAQSTHVETGPGEIRAIRIVLDDPIVDDASEEILPTGPTIELWHATRHSDVVDVLRSALPEIELRVAADLEASGQLAEEVGAHTGPAGHLLRNLFGQWPYRLEIESGRDRTVVTIHEARGPAPR